MMRQTRAEWQEVRWRVKGTVGLTALGALVGVVAWLWRALGAEASLPDMVRALRLSVDMWPFWGVVGGCAVIGASVAWGLFWRARVTEADEHESDVGMRGPRL